MSVVEIAIEAATFAGRFLASAFVELLIGFLIQRPGYYILRTVMLRNKEEADPHGIWVYFLSFFFWVTLGGAVYAVHFLIGR